MIGQATASLEAPPRRWAQRAWGSAYLHRRQDWRVLWPHLRALPRTGIRVLDAGCGPGAWTLELAARRPGWRLVGLDRRPPAAAEDAAARLGLQNAEFHQGAFLDFAPAEAFDVVLTVHSAHYTFDDGDGAALFQRFRDWLAPGGVLLLLGPRREPEIPFVRWLPRPRLEYVFTLDALREACATAGLRIETCAPAIGPLGTIAKQLDCLAAGPLRRLVLTAGLYPLQLLLVSLDPPRGSTGGASFACLLAARAPLAKERA